MLHEEGVQRDPVPDVHDLPQAGFRFLGRARADHAEPVRDAVDVRVHGDGRDPVAEHQHAVRGLRSDPRQGGELLERTGYRATESVQDHPGTLPDHSGLDPIEPGGSDQRFDVARTGRGQRHGIRKASEQARARRIRVRVPGPLGEDRSHEHLEGILSVVPQVRRPPIAAFVQGGQAVQYCFPVQPGSFGSARHQGLRTRRLRGLDVGPAAEAGDANGPSPGSERSGSSWSSGRSSSPMR